ncbi:MAG: RDD family protein [Fibrobacter sp.]|jgi:uncharacterized RDD family membrane protein YckC|nr:RDD family protein [Fibrobacter sp.]
MDSFHPETPNANADSYGGQAGTPEYGKAPLLRRFFAILIDNLFVFLILIPAFLFGLLSVMEFDAADFGSDSIFEKNYSLFGGNPLVIVVSVGLTVIFFLFAGVYNFFKDGMKNGQSFGKRTMNLRVVHLPTGKPCNYLQSFFRNFIGQLLSWIPYAGWLIEPIFVIANDRGRRLGDFAANTQVIEASPNPAPETEVLPPAP